MARVLVVDDDRDSTDALGQFLAKEGHSVQSAADAEGALHRVRAWKPHLLLLDVNLPDLSGIDIIPKIRAASAEDYVSIVLVSGNDSMEDVLRRVDAGADDYLTKPYRSQDLMTRVRVMLKLKEAQDAIRRAHHRIEELNSLDSTTGLLNFQSFYRRAEEEIMRSKRFRKPISLLAVDLDGFALINRSEGFPFGNHVLREVSKRIKECVRSMDVVGHVAGDEFLVLLLETDLASAEYTAERIRDAIRSKPCRSDRQSAQLTCSIGIAGIPANSNAQEDVQELLRIALEAVHSAKQGGRDRVEVYSYA